MRNKIKAIIVGAAIVAATVVPASAADAASSQTVHVAAAAPYCSPLVQWSGYAPFFWWLIGGRC